MQRKLVSCKGARKPSKGDTVGPVSKTRRQLEESYRSFIFFHFLWPDVVNSVLNLGGKRKGRKGGKQGRRRGKFIFYSFCPFHFVAFSIVLFLFSFLWEQLDISITLENVKLHFKFMGNNKILWKSQKMNTFKCLSSKKLHNLLFNPFFFLLVSAGKKVVVV